MDSYQILNDQYLALKQEHNDLNRDYSQNWQRTQEIEVEMQDLSVEMSNHPEKDTVTL